MAGDEVGGRLAETPDDGGSHEAADGPLLSRADALKIAGGAAVGILGAAAGADAPRVLARAATPRTKDTQIVRCVIYPGIGIARVGNSPTDYFVGPEVPGISANAGHRYKDSHGRVKRQAARFRLYGLNRAGEVVKEMTAPDADITWSVHLANKKAAWYQFKFPLDLPDAYSLMAGQRSRLRNEHIKGAARRALVIDPGPRSIRGTNAGGPGHRFDTGTFHGRRVPLGELRTDSAGHLLVLGGFGQSGSFDGSHLAHVSNNDGWYDDISDGPVTATVVLRGRALPVTPAWVVVAPPNYAPDIRSIVTLYDLVLNAYAAGGRGPSRPVSFTQDIYPIFQRFSRMQWVNEGFFHLYGWMANDDFMSADYMKLLTDASASNAAFRRRAFGRFRSPADANRVDAWPRIYGDSIFEAVTAPTHLYLTVTPEQYRNLGEWAKGNFLSDWNPNRRVPRTLEEIPLQSRPAALTRAALEACCGGPFHPGEEIPWIMRNLSLYDGFARLRMRSAHDPAEPDYGSELTPQEAMGPRGPLHRSGPGDITRWMAVPWQTDTANCGAAYRGTTASQPADNLPTFWPAVVPNLVLTERLYGEIMKRNASKGERTTAFHMREPWARHLQSEGKLPGANAPRNEQFVRVWPKMGFVVPRPGPHDPSLPSEMYVETESGF